jgi:NAD(P)-dependent dehydrogenase (short-subunit alcohol dehydrogenase family)
LTAADATALIQHATRELGRVGVLVNNAGIQHARIDMERARRP